ncbi:MAG: hypothetical protein KatS3mg110_2743 [Pirellulaceae bacterium]|nr:MAG: hypothetical protein KatS3mg110_2743 [Pirellulaceae bacterium]
MARLEACVVRETCLVNRLVQLGNNPQAKSRVGVGLWATCLVLLAAPLPAAPPDSPQAVGTYYIALPKVLARSGPGLDYYATDLLMEGERVHVRQAKGTWLGIEPLESSFCWVERTAVDWEPQRKEARVVAPEVPVWVGSSLLPIDRHIHQVTLKAGDTVEVLGHVRLANQSDADSPNEWLKIRPPTGELRWIEQSAVEPPNPTKMRADQKTAEAATACAFGEFPSLAGRHSMAEQPQRWQQAVGGWQARGETVAWSSSLDRPLEELDTSAGDLAGSDPRSPFPGRSFDDRLASLLVALSRQAVRRASSQELEKLVAEAQRLADQAQTAHQRAESGRLLQQARSLLALTAAREKLQGRLSLPETTAERAVGSGLRAEGVDASPDGADRDERATDSPYVVEGWLMPVARLASSAPPYAVMDDDGQPLAFVTPVPGLNLRRYVDQRVGIVGERSFAVLGQSHVIAHRAVLLDRHANRGGP